MPSCEDILKAVDDAMRTESDRLAAPGTAAAVEQGIGVAHAMRAVRDAVRRVFEQDSC